MNKKIVFPIALLLCLQNYKTESVLLKSYRDKNLIISNTPPLPGILDYFLNLIFGPMLANIIKFTIFYITVSDKFLALLLFNRHLSYKLIFINISEKKKNIFLQSLFLGLSLVCDLSTFFDILLFLALEITKYFEKLTNRKTNIFKETFKFLKKIICLLSISFCIYISTFYLDYKLRPITKSTPLSLEFNSSFLNLKPIHLNIKDKSYITLINRYHKTYITFEDDKIKATPTLNSNCVWQIRYNDKNKFRLLHVNTRKFLAINHVNEKDKFFNLELSDWDSIKGTNNELFKVDKHLQARRTLFRIINTNTGLYLGINKFNEVYGSLYSNIKHRYFYISDNLNIIDDLDKEDKTYVVNNDESTRRDNQNIDNGGEDNSARDSDRNKNNRQYIKYPEKTFLAKIFEHTKFLFIGQEQKLDILHLLIIFLIPIVKLMKVVLRTRRVCKVLICSKMVFIWIKCILLLIYCNDNNYIENMKIILKYMFLKEVCKLSSGIYMPVMLATMIYTK